MPVESLAQRLSATNLDKMSERELRVLLTSLLDGMQAICAKLDADATVTDTNYAATLATFIID
jgi:hypothetical protein